MDIAFPCETRVPLQWVLGGVSGVTFFITTMNNPTESEFASVPCLLRLVIFRDLLFLDVLFIALLSTR